MDRYCVLRSYTLKETIDQIDENHDRVVMVVNEKNKVIGVVSQGDIIRALSSGKSLYGRVDSIMQSGFLYLKERDMACAEKLFKEKKITLLPIVDDEFMLRGVITLTDMYNYLEKKVYE